MNFMKKIFLLLFIFPSVCFCQSMESRAYIQQENDYPGYIHYTMKVFPAKNDKSFKIELSQVDSLGKEEILSEPFINIKTVIYKKGYKMESGKTLESLYVAIAENDKWNDDYIVIRNCSESIYLSGTITLKKNGTFKIKIFNKDKMFFEQSFNI